MTLASARNLLGVWPYELPFDGEPKVERLDLVPYPLGTVSWYDGDIFFLCAL